MRISAIIVNYNSGPLLAECVSSLRENLMVDHSDDEIIVVDNDSSDKSVAAVECIETLKIIKSRVNSGYAAGCNVGASHAAGDIFLFLNPDTVLSTPADSVRAIFEQNGSIAAVAPVIVENGEPCNSLRPFPTVVSDALDEFGLRSAEKKWHEFTKTALREKGFFRGYSQGSAFFVRREDFEQVIGFDEDYFLYYEELDLYKRLAAEGHEFHYDTGCVFWHASGGSSAALGWQKTAIRYNSKIRYFSKHLSGKKLAVHKTLFLTALPLKILSYLPLILFRRRTSEKINAYLYGFNLYLFGHKQRRRQTGPSSREVSL